MSQYELTGGVGVIWVIHTRFKRTPVMTCAQFGSPTRPIPRGTFRVAGDRNDTTTDDPSYRAWKHKWMRSRGERG